MNLDDMLAKRPVNRASVNAKKSKLNYEEIVSKTVWPNGLHCTGCGERILNGRRAIWFGMEPFGEECVK